MRRGYEDLVRSIVLKSLRDLSGTRDVRAHFTAKSIERNIPFPQLVNQDEYGSINPRDILQILEESYRGGEEGLSSIVVLDPRKVVHAYRFLENGKKTFKERPNLPRPMRPALDKFYRRLAERTASRKDREFFTIHTLRSTPPNTLMDSTGVTANALQWLAFQERAQDVTIPTSTGSHFSRFYIAKLE
jgi:hypothetical protein